MANLRGFDANEVEPISFEPLPPGRYLAVVSHSEEKPTKSGNGSYLQLTFQVIDGDHKDRLLWSRLNLDNPSAMAVRIAQAQLSAICHAVSVMEPTDSTELHNLPLLIHVRCKKREDTGELTNEIKGYSPRERPHGAAGTSPPIEDSPPSNDVTPPWKRAS